LDKDLLNANTRLYYKLWQVDFDGTKTDLGTRMVQADGIENTIQIYPNPATDAVWIKPGEGNAIDAIEIYTLTGKLVNIWSNSKQNTNNEAILLPLAGLNPGMYVLHIKVGNEVIIKKLNLM
jgi:hypothetical protein